MPLQTFCQVRLVLAAVCCSIVASCSATRADAAQRLEVDVVDADVWAYELTVTGELREPGQLEACEVQAARGAYEAQLTAAATFRARIRLTPGVNEARAKCRTRAGVNLTSPPRHYRVRLPGTPTAVARIASVPEQKSSLILDGSSSTTNPSTKRPIARFQWYLGDTTDSAALLGEGVRVEQPRPTHRQLYTLRVSDDRGEHDMARVLYRPDGAQPDDLRSAVVYGVLPPLYGAPPLAAVTAALPSLAELGVDVLWLAPLFRAPAGDFGYAVTDYFDVRSDYGTGAELRELVTRAHALGLRVLLDLPANHSSREHPYFVQAAALGPRSHYFDFYARDAGGQPTHYFDWENLPNFNYGNVEVTRFMQEATAYWLSTYNIDGYRLDAAWGIRAQPGAVAAARSGAPAHPSAARVDRRSLRAPMVRARSLAWV